MLVNRSRRASWPVASMMALVLRRPAIITDTSDRTVGESTSISFPMRASGFAREVPLEAAHR
jgi:hypothetical protein